MRYSNSISLFLYILSTNINNVASLPNPVAEPAPFDWPHWIQSIVNPSPEQVKEKEDQERLQPLEHTLTQSPLSNSMSQRTNCHDTSLCGVQHPIDKLCVSCPSDGSSWIGGGCPDQQCMTGNIRICEWVIQPVKPCTKNATLPDANPTSSNDTSTAVTSNEN